MRRRHRLSGRRSFVATMQAQPVQGGGGLRMHALVNQLPHTRIGMAVRGAGSAVERNRARRRLRAALTPHLERLAGVDVVVVAPARTAGVPWPELVRSVRQCVTRAVA